MLDFRNALEIRHDDNSVFTDYKNEALDFTRDPFTIALDKDEDYLYIGFHKPINSLYIDIITSNVNGGNITAEYFGGGTFKPIKGLYDQTNNLSRNGGVTWHRNQDDEEVTTIDSTELYWYRFSTSITWSDVELNAVNILFSDDQALKLKFNKILSDELLDGEANHNKVHAGCRDEIVSAIIRRGYVKLDGTRDDVSSANITAWDLHDIYEVKEAATYLALSRIFFDFSDNDEDIFMAKSDKYMSIYEKSIDLVRLSVDVNDDGKMDDSENLPESRTKYITR